MSKVARAAGNITPAARRGFLLRVCKASEHRYGRRSFEVPMTTKNELLKEYGEALRQGTAGVFVGAGLSRSSGFVDWKGLLRNIASDLGLDIDRESDLIAVAQYHHNERNGRGTLNQLLIDEFSKKAQASENHRLIAEMPIRTVWTTNYDTLLEDAAKAAGRNWDVKVRTESLALTLPSRDAVLYKMHGDISQPGEAVLTKEDYETYHEKRGLFAEQLKGDLISKTFLFLGFSFTDPNMDYVLARIKALLGKNQRSHFCIMKRPKRPAGKGKALAEFEYERTKLNLRIADLRRYSINAVLVDEYDEITGLLRQIAKEGSRNKIFVSGSTEESAPNRAMVATFSRLLGQELARGGFHLVNGFGKGVGSDVIGGALEVLLPSLPVGGDLLSRITLRPFTQPSKTQKNLAPLYTKYREAMIGLAGTAIFISGNKPAGIGKKLKVANGVEEEFSISEAHGKLLIPVGATGYAAEKLWKQQLSVIGKTLPNKAARDLFQKLGTKTAEPKDLVSWVLALHKAALAP